MAMILEFKSRCAREAAQESGEAASAEIIIFPGVRREHYVEQPKQRRRERARPKRDRLELPD